MHRILIPVLLVLTVAAPRGLIAQQTRSDSLAVVVRQLMARLDSLQAVVRQLQNAGRDTSEVVDEMAALRAAAMEAVGGPSDSMTPRADQPAGSQTRNLNRLNPEISATGDVRFRSDPDNPTEDNFVVREFEFSIQSALDPFSHTKIYLTFEEDEFHLEEAYLYWPTLPGHLRLDVGRLRQQVGELNRWHLHALPEAEYPLVYQDFFGEEGLVGDGARLSLLLPTGGALGVQELSVEGVIGGNEVLFEEGNRPSVLAHLNNFFELSPATFFQVGGTVIYGENPDIGLKTSMFGGNFRLSWRPPSQSRYRSFTLRGELLYLNKSFNGVSASNLGGYVGAVYQMSQRLFAGVRGDFLEPVDGGDDVWALTPHITWWQSEWAYIRAQWQHTDVAGARQNELQVQVVWSVGPHKHETY